MLYTTEIDGLMYTTLYSLRNHIWIMSDNDKKEYNGTVVYCTTGNGRSAGHKIITVKGNKISFSRTVK